MSKKALDAFLRRNPDAIGCRIPFALGSKLFIVGLSSKAEQAGLRRGDLVKTLAGLPIAEPDDLGRAVAQLSTGSPVTVVVARRGQETTVAAPCEPQRDAWFATKRALEAAANADWDTCQASALDIIRARGFASASALEIRARCAIVQAAVQRRGKSGNLALARIVYEWRQAVIREKSYEPGGLDEVRSAVLSDVTGLRQAGFAEFASDLEEQLRTAPVRVAQEEQAIAAAQPPAQSTPQISQGTGFLVRPDGVVLTAFHVVEGAKSIAVRCLGREAVLATLGDTARSVDLAVLRTSLAATPYLSVRDARSVKPGEAVFTIGFPAAILLGPEPKFTDGAISALSGPGRESSLMQITVPIQPGNSGGPVVAGDGSVVGVVTATEAILAFVQVTGTLPQNINWAVKAEYARPLFDQPVPRPPAKTRSEAIQRATQASCLVLAEQ